MSSPIALWFVRLALVAPRVTPARSDQDYLLIEFLTWESVGVSGRQVETKMGDERGTLPPWSSFSPSGPGTIPAGLQQGSSRPAIKPSCSQVHYGSAGMQKSVSFCGSQRLGTVEAEPLPSSLQSTARNFGLSCRS